VPGLLSPQQVLESVAEHQALRLHFPGQKDKASSLTTSLNILLGHSSLKSGIKGREELGLGNMRYRASDQMLNFSTICLFQRPKAPDVKRLK
jgi:hypothetical protein